MLRSFGELYESAHDLNLAKVARGFRADLAQWAWAASLTIAASQSSANQWYLKRQVELLFHTDSYGYRQGGPRWDAVATSRERCREFCGSRGEIPADHPTVAARRAQPAPLAVIFTR